MDHNKAIIEENKKLCFRLNKSISMRKSIWSNKKNQNGNFDQNNKMKLLWEKMSDFYEKEKVWFLYRLFSDFQNDFSVGSLKLNP